MPPPDVVYSISPSKVPAVVQVLVGKATVICPFAALVIVAVIVLSTLVVPTFLILNLTLPPVKFTAAQVVLSSTSKVLPEAAVLLSFNVKFNSGRVSPTTNSVSYTHLTLPTTPYV